MLLLALITSLKITAIYTIVQQGMLLHPVRASVATQFDNLFGLTISKYVQKPLWSCLPCMSSFWTVILTLSFDINLILIVCGINAIIDKYLTDGGSVSF